MEIVSLLLIFQPNRLIKKKKQKLGNTPTKIGFRGPTTSQTVSTFFASSQAQLDIHLTDIYFHVFFF